jgi:hypothetical protein
MLKGSGMEISICKTYPILNQLEMRVISCTQLSFAAVIYTSSVPMPKYISDSCWSIYNMSTEI